jgi:hypothetical protein
MKKLNATACLLIFGALSISNTLFAQSSKTVSISNVKEISVSSGIDLYLSQSGTETLRVVGDQELVEKVLIEKDGTGLRIKYKEGTNWSGMFRKQQQVKVYVNVKGLNELSASGGSNVYTQNTIKTDRFALHASGGSDVKMSLVCKDVVIESSGGCDINLDGSATNMDLRTSGGSDVNAQKFSVNYAKVNASGGSDATIHVNKALEANASGGSDVSFSGDAAYKKTSSSKSGSVKRIN